MKKQDSALLSNKKRQSNRCFIINQYLFDQDLQMTFAKYSQKTGSKNVKGGSQKRKIWDNIHGFIYFDQIIWSFIDTCEFQRLRNIKQLGCSEYVFPGATHTRFQHCIGTAYLAQQFVKYLIENHPEEYPQQIRKEALLTCTLAGLLHDLGHGPYSHTFDSQIVTKINRDGKIQKWSHEKASVQLFKHMNELQQLKGKLLDHQIQRIITLIEGKVPQNAQREWQYQLISNYINGIDVDKLDYFRRDAFYLGAKNIYIDHQLLMNQARIIKHSFIYKNKLVTRKVIAYPTKYVQTVYNIFHSRYKLYKIYYFNIKSTGIEQMISDVLKLVKDRFKIQKSCELIFTEPSHYLGLDDSILDKVYFEYERILEKKQEYSQIRAMLQQNSKQKDPASQQTLKIMEEFFERNQLQYQKNFKEASQILTRIKKRDIYKFVKELTYQVKQNNVLHADYIFEQEFKKQKIIQKISELGNIDPNQICVTIHFVSFGMKDANPLRKVSFFKKEEEQAFGRTIISQQEAATLSLLFTNAFVESSIKVYIKRDDPKLFLQVDKAFEEFRIFFQSHLPMTKGMGGRTPVKQKEEEKPSQENIKAQDLVIQKTN